MNDANRVNPDELSVITNKLMLYKKDEDLSFEELDNLFTDINYQYKTDNTKKINLIESELLNNLNIISLIHKNNITVLEREIESSRKREEEAIAIFSSKNE